MRKLIASELGSALLPTAVTVACFLVFLGLVYESQRLWNTVYASQSATALANQIHQALKNKSVCAANLSGKSIGVDQPLALEKVVQPDPTHKSDELVEVRSPSSSFRIQAFRLLPQMAFVTGQWLAEFEIVGHGAAKDALERSFPVFLEVKDGKIISCTSGLDRNFELKRKACGIASDGNFAWHEAEGVCVDQNPQNELASTPDDEE